MDKIDNLMAEMKENIKDSQKGQVTPKKYLKNKIPHPQFQVLLIYGNNSPTIAGDDL